MTAETAQNLEGAAWEGAEPSPEDDAQQLTVHEGGPTSDPHSAHPPDWQENANHFNSPVFPTRVRGFEDLEEELRAIRGDLSKALTKPT